MIWGRGTLARVQPASRYKEILKFYPRAHCIEVKVVIHNSIKCYAMQQIMQTYSIKSEWADSKSNSKFLRSAFLHNLTGCFLYQGPISTCDCISGQGWIPIVWGSPNIHHTRTALYQGTHATTEPVSKWSNAARVRCKLKKSSGLSSN